MKAIFKISAILLCGVLYSGCNWVIAASFDCAKASTVNEHLICNDPELSRLDDELSAIHQQAKIATNNQEEFKTENRTAYKDREKKCADKACLIDWYLARKDSLNKITAPESTTHQSVAATVSRPIELNSRSSNLDEPNAPHKQEEKPSIWSFAFWIGLGVAILAFFKKGITIYKRWRTKRALDEVYKNNSAIGIFLPDLVYAQSHQKITKGKDSNTSVSLWKVNLPIAKCITVVERAAWTAEVGVLNQSAYANAMHRHETALNKYENERKQFHSRENAKHRSNNSYVAASWNGTPPSPPRKAEFVDYHPENGVSTTRVQHDWKVATRPSSIENVTGQNISSPFNLDKQHAILSIYENILQTHLNDVPAQTADASTLKLNDDYVFETEQKTIHAAVQNSAQSSLGEFYKNFSIVDIHLKLEVANLRYLPLVVSQTNSGKDSAVFVHDHLAPDMVIE